MRFDEVDRILYRHDLFGSIIRNLAPEFLLKGHHELDRVEAVGAEIGTGRVLTGLCRRIDPTLSARSVCTPAEVDAFIKAL